MDNPFVVSVVDLDNDVQLGQQVKNLRGDTDRDAIGIRQFVSRVRFLAFHKSFDYQRGNQQCEKIFITPADILAVSFETEFLYVLGRIRNFRTEEADEP